jgi:hypothetical protein
MSADGPATSGFIAEVVRPRFVPEMRPTAFNFLVAIVGTVHHPLPL